MFDDSHITKVFGKVQAYINQYEEVTGIVISEDEIDQVHIKSIPKLPKPAKLVKSTTSNQKKEYTKKSTNKDKTVCVYLHVNPIAQEIFYVGIGSIQRAYESNKFKRSTYWIEYIKSIERKHQVIVIHTGLTWDKAIEIEKQLIKQIGRKDLGLGTLVNRSNGGEGKQSTNVWTNRELELEALKYEKRGEFYKNSRGAYKSAARREILDRICSHMPSYPGKNNFKLTKENCRKVALLYYTKVSMFREKKSIYNAIIRNGWSKELFAHMKQFISKEECREVANKFNRKTDLMKANKYIYNLIIKNKWSKELFAHMTQPIDKEYCKEVALNFTRRTDLMTKNKYIYNKIHAQNWDEELFAHMK